VTARWRSVVAWTAVGLSVALLTVSMAIKIEAGMLLGADDSLLVAPGVLGGLAFAVVGALVASRTGNAVGWIFLGITVGASISLPSQNWVEVAIAERREVPFLGVANWLSQWPFFVALGLLIAVFYLYPDGRLPSGRWTVPWRIYVTSFTITVIGFAIQPYEQRIVGTTVTNPVAVALVDPVIGGVLAIAGILLVISAFVSLASLIVRARGAGPELRQQIRWLGAVGRIGAVLFLLLLVGGFTLGAEEGAAAEDVADVVMFLLVLTVVVGIPVSTAVAIFRYRLYDLNLVIRRAVIVATMAAAITLVYVGVVVAVPFVIRGGSAEGVDVVSLLAAAVVAIAFDPLRRGARRIADRIVYGERATPYEVLTAFGARVGETYASEDVATRMAQILTEGTGAERGTVWLRIGGELRREAVWPDGGDGTTGGSLPIAGDALPTIADEHAVEVRHQGELLGALSVTMPASDPIDPAKERLVADLAAQAGLVLRNVRLIEELRASRQRLVAAQDEERRKLERNLHDGAQQQLVALAVQLKLARTLVERDREKAGALLEALQTSAQDALDDLRDLARGIYPPLLADQGLAAALEAQARKATIPVAIDPDGIGRYPREVESAVYFSCLEALNNVAKYAEASSAVVTLGEHDGALTFSIVDDGRGFDAAATSYGTGLQGIADRLDAVGGRLDVRSRPGEGTTITGRFDRPQVST
jgi:signal transduction histidine kinase